MKLFALLVLLLFLVPINSLQSQASSGSQKTVTVITNVDPTQLSSDYGKLVQKYVQALLNNGQQVDSNGMKWKKYLNLPSNDTEISQYYYGLYYGASGIGSLFLELYKNTQNTTYLDYAEKAGNYLLYSSSNTSYGYVWSKSEDSNWIYSSEKYGLAGIASFLLALYQSSGNNTYLEYAESTLHLLYEFKTVTPTGYFFNYSLPLSAQITDFIYGVTGVAKAYLNAYQVTGNKSYLEICIKSMSWVLNQTEYTSQSEDGMRKVLYSPDPTYPYYFTGYQAGASGIGDFLLTLYNVTKQENYVLYAKQLANWLIYKENGTGYWTANNTVDYLTNQETNNEEGTFTGYSAGSSGVGIFFMDLYQTTQEAKYLAPITRITKFLLDNAHSNGNQTYWNAQITGTFMNQVRTGLSLGVAGIGLYFLKYYEMFGANDALSALQGIFNFYSGITTSEGLVPVIVGDSNVIYDSSYLDGLTGIALFTDRAATNVLKTPLYNSSILTVTQGTSLTGPVTWTSECGLINCQSGVPQTTTSKSKTAGDMFLLYSLLLLLPVMGIIRRKVKRT